ncbi:peptidoglycan recognition protein family protein [Sanguibacter suaedae]|uniref:N-acetylmuramoyl-L-alanine amidase n=1 Tax=Sanguibacter suaedae TaxID=2795737 RepID=A0A934MDG4_9MICO|nr:peptidoglycan recognition protein [Sanguibacter suaedae]MBI9114779.1 N-acetylmuramoyl-L-alanine amidase [Sanguibacter suaedae]
MSGFLVGLPVAAAADGTRSVAAQPAVTTDARTATTPTDVEELEVDGVDPVAKAELEQADAAVGDVTAAAEPDLDPGLEVQDPLGVLPDGTTPAALTEQLTVDPFSVMGVTWDLDPGLQDVVVQFRTFREGAWTDWGWAAPAELSVEDESGQEPPTRGATDAIFVPDSTGVQVMVSSSTGTIENVKIVLIDPGAGPEGDGASTSSGAPTPAPAPDAGADAEPTDPSPTANPDTTAPTSDATPEPGIEPTEPTAPETSPTTEAPRDTAPPSEPIAPVQPVEPEQPADARTAEMTVEPMSAALPADARALALATAVMPQPRIVTRAQWGVGAPVCSGGYSAATLAAVVHHTASSNSYTAAQVPGLLRGIYEYHTRPEAAGGRGWCDVGYNFFVDKFGTIYEGRAGGIDQPVIGVHVGGFNSRVIGVSAIGNYQDAPVSAAMAESISQIIAWKFTQHRILANANVTLVSGGGATKFPAGTSVTFNTIFAHRDSQSTACPGINLYNRLGDIRNRVAALSNQVVRESPIGSWDVVRGGNSSVRVAGWARDPDTTGAIQVEVLVDGRKAATFSADQQRADVGRHGYDAQVPAAAGKRVVCVRYLNQGGGSNVHVGCREAMVLASNPVGVIDTVSSTSSTISFSGWARDPDSTSPIRVHAYLDGRPMLAISADQPRADVQKSAPNEAGPRHGFSGSMPARAGKHTVCLYGINVGPGSNTVLGCRDVVVQNKVPIGVIDRAEPVGTDGIRVSGWMLDPDTDASISAHFFVDGRLVRGVLASEDRPDVGRIHGRGSAHGFDVVIPATAGKHEVCVFAIDSNGGGNPRIGCRTVTVTNAVPIGVIDAVSASLSREVRIHGWALDPDTSDPVRVHVYVDGIPTQGLTADRMRSDIGRIYGLGPMRGFDTSIRVDSGRRVVCAYAIDASGGRNALLGCRTVVVP